MIRPSANSMLPFLSLFVAISIPLAKGQGHLPNAASPNTPSFPQGSDFAAFPEFLPGLTIHMRVRIGENGWAVKLLEWGDERNPSQSLCIRARPAQNDRWDAVDQNYRNFPDSSGRCDVLEAEVAVKTGRPEWSALRVGVPAARLGKGRTHDVILCFRSGALELHVDGVLVDENYAFGKISAGTVLRTAKNFDGEVLSAEVLPRALSPEEIHERSGGENQVAQRKLEILGSEQPRMQYWSPNGHNQWVGDVMFGDLISFDPGRLHLFYLVDRRHGHSKFGAGGHSIAHMSTSDLVHWERHPLAVAQDEWNSLGTGRPFVFDGKLVLGYGMHTSRLIPKPDLLEFKPDPKEGYTAKPFSLTGDAGGGKFPMGSTFAESTDGIHFQKSGLLIHECQNPNIVPSVDGNGYLMLAGYGQRGLWQSSDMKHWHLKDPDIIPPPWLSQTRNTDECQCWFEWNGWHYIIAGRTGFWISRSQTGPYWEGPDKTNNAFVKPRWDLYDGLWVPMVAEFKEGRRILAGFLTGPDFDWGGHLVFRELIQMKDGTLGLKWPKELIPLGQGRINFQIRAGGRTLGGTSVSVSGESNTWGTISNLPRSLKLFLKITPGPAATQLGVLALGENGLGCALSFLPLKGRAQWSAANKDRLPDDIPALEEILANDPAPIWEMKNPHLPFKGGDFAISNVEGLGKPFEVEMIFSYDDKTKSTIVDAWIAGHRTMITRRNGLVMDTLQLIANGPAKFEIISMEKIP